MTEADRLAAANCAANLAALSMSQPRLAQSLAGDLEKLEWTFGRDGALTAIENDQWLGGCSVPRLAAEKVLRSLEPGTGTACFLNPKHAGEIRAALGRLHATQALLCIIPDARLLATMWHCEDFSPELRTGRLWIAAGEAWADALQQLLTDVPGLSTPARFVRIPYHQPDELEARISTSQQVFAEVNTRRNAQIASLRETWMGRGPSKEVTRICVVASPNFRLWDDAGQTLFETMTSANAGGFCWSRFNPDSPADSSPLALATSLARSDAVVTANLFRVDAAGVASERLPWITWVTTPRIAAWPGADSSDHVVLADPAWQPLAHAAGWPEDRLRVATWPTVSQSRPGNASTGTHVAMIADTFSLEAPESLAEFSSHVLLWERIRAQIAADPFSVGEEATEWLKQMATSADVSVAEIDVPLFIHRLIEPAYQQALADLVIDAGLPFQIYGKGWTEIPRFVPAAMGPVTSREAFFDTADRAACLIHTSPHGHAHAIDGLARPVVRGSTAGRAAFFQAIERALRGNAKPCGPTAPPLSAELIETLARTVFRPITPPPSSVAA